MPETSEQRRAQIVRSEWLLQHRASCPARFDSSCPITARKDERDVSPVQHLRYRRDAFACDVHVQHRCADVEILQALKPLVDTPCRDCNDAAELGQIL